MISIDIQITRTLTTELKESEAKVSVRITDNNGVNENIKFADTKTLRRCMGSNNLLEGGLKLALVKSKTAQHLFPGAIFAGQEIEICGARFSNEDFKTTWGRLRYGN